MRMIRRDIQRLVRRHGGADLRGRKVNHGQPQVGSTDPTDEATVVFDGGDGAAINDYHLATISPSRLGEGISNDHDGNPGRCSLASHR